MKVALETRIDKLTSPRLKKAIVFSGWLTGTNAVGKLTPMYGIKYSMSRETLGETRCWPRITRQAMMQRLQG